HQGACRVDGRGNRRNCSIFKPFETASAKECGRWVHGRSWVEEVGGRTTRQEMDGGRRGDLSGNGKNHRSLQSEPERKRRALLWPSLPLGLGLQHCNLARYHRI